MTIVTTHYRGTPARPRAHKYVCLRAVQGHVHIEATGTTVALELSCHEGSFSSLHLSLEEAHALAELLKDSVPDLESSCTAPLPAHAVEVVAA